MNWTRANDAAEHSRGRLDRQRLGETGHALDEQVALREQADEHALEHRVLPGDDPADLEERLLELFLRVLGRQLGVFVGVGHGGVPFYRLERLIRKHACSWIGVNGA